MAHRYEDRIRNCKDAREYHRWVARAWGDDSNGQKESTMTPEDAMSLLWQCEHKFPSSASRKSGFALLRMWKIVGFPITCPRMTEIILMLHEQLSDRTTVWNTAVALLQESVPEDVVATCTGRATKLLARCACPQNREFSDCPCVGHTVLRIVTANESEPSDVWVHALFAAVSVNCDRETLMDLSFHTTLPPCKKVDTARQVSSTLSTLPVAAAVFSAIMGGDVEEITRRAEELPTEAEKLTVAAFFLAFSRKNADRTDAVLPAILTILIQLERYQEAALTATIAFRKGRATKYHPVLLHLTVFMPRIHSDVFYYYWQFIHRQVTPALLREFCAMYGALLRSREPSVHIGMTRILGEFFHAAPREFTPAMWMRLVYGMCQIAAHSDTEYCDCTSCREAPQWTTEVAESLRKVILCHPPRGAPVRAVFETVLRTYDLSQYEPYARAAVVYAAIRAGCIPDRADVESTYALMPSRAREAAWMGIHARLDEVRWAASFLAVNPFPRPERLRYDKHIRPIEESLERVFTGANRAVLEAHQATLLFECRHAYPTPRTQSVVRTLCRTIHGSNALMENVRSLPDVSESPRDHSFAQLVIGTVCARIRNGGPDTVPPVPRL